jgi:hypothetical protein
MTTYVEARDAIVGYLHPAWTAGYPGTKIIYENTLQVDLDSVGSSFIQVSIDFQDSMRQGVDASPISKTWGVVTLRLFTKEGTGTKVALQMFDWLTALMKYRKLGEVTLDCPRPGKKISRDGWSSADLIVDFSFWQ